MKNILKLANFYLKASEDSLCPCDNGKLFSECHGKLDEDEEKDSPKKPTNLGDLCIIKTNFPDADFWVIRKGSEEKVGEPVKDFNPENIGLKIKEEYEGKIIPSFIFYVVQYIHQLGIFKNLAKGTLRLKHISVNDVKSASVKSIMKSII